MNIQYSHIEFSIYVPPPSTPQRSVQKKCAHRRFHELHVCENRAVHRTVTVCITACTKKSYESYLVAYNKHWHWNFLGTSHRSPRVYMTS
jgi:hypothetical protein